MSDDDEPLDPALAEAIVMDAVRDALSRAVEDTLRSWLDGMQRLSDAMREFQTRVEEMAEEMAAEAEPREPWESDPDAWKR